MSHPEEISAALDAEEMRKKVIAETAAAMRGNLDWPGLDFVQAEHVKRLVEMFNAQNAEINDLQEKLWVNRAFGRRDTGDGK